MTEWGGGGDSGLSHAHLIPLQTAILQSQLFGLLRLCTGPSVSRFGSPLRGDNPHSVRQCDSIIIDFTLGSTGFETLTLPA